MLLFIYLSCISVTHALNGYSLARSQTRANTQTSLARSQTRANAQTSLARSQTMYRLDPLNR